MKTRIRLLLAVLRKDFRLFWPLAMLIGALRVATVIPHVMEGNAPVVVLMGIAIPLLTALLVLVLLYEDPVVSITHDWLTRPIPGFTLLAAKAVFLVLVIFVPSILARAVYELAHGHSLGESLLVGIDASASSIQLLAILALMAFAAITSGIRQAFVVALVAIAITFVVSMPRAPSFEAVARGTTGSGWVASDGAALLVALGAALVLWLQYHHRRTWLARGIAAATPVAAYAVLLSLSWQGVFAVQKSLSREPAAAALVNVGIPERCFATRDTDGSVRYGSQPFPPDPFEQDRVRLAGPGALPFWTRLVLRSIPAGHWLKVNQVDLTYRVGDRVVVHPYAGRPDFGWANAGVRDGVAADNRWVLTRDEQQRLATTPGVESHFVYSMSLLEPVASATISAGTPRRYLPGFGYCSVSATASATQSTAYVMEVNCFKPGSQAAQLVAFLEDQGESVGSRMDVADFTPAALELWGGKYYRMQFFSRTVPVPAVRLVAYEARVHFDREIVVPGVLGGPLSKCPITVGAAK